MGGEPFLWHGAAVGAVIGAVSTCVLWAADMKLAGGGFGLSALLAIHLENPIHGVTDLLPLGLSWAGWSIETLRAHSRVSEASGDPWADTQLSERLLDAALLVSAEGKILEANSSAEVIFGHRIGAMQGLALRDILPGHDDQEQTKSREVQSPSLEILGVQWEMRAVRADNVSFDALVTVSPTTGRRFIYTVRSRHGQVAEDGTVPESWVAERKELIRERDEAIETSKAKSEFLANMSHELRTPLNAIIGYSELLNEELSDQGVDMTSDLVKVSSSAKHLLSLINNILDLSKIEAGRMSVVLEPIQVAELVRDVRTNIEPLAAKNGNTLEVKIDGVSVVRGDAMQLRQALINLLGNACKFTENGTITVEVVQHPGSDYFVAFNIHDTGIGMSEQQLGRLFQQYVQADRSIQAKYGGTGLGLTISKRFIEMMGGELTATSALGEGSVFTVLIPSGYHQSSTHVANFTMPARGGLTIVPTTAPDELLKWLLVIDDDDEALQQIYVRKLETAGYIVEVFRDGQSGLERALMGRPYAVLIDTRVERGWEVLGKLTSESALLDVPVLVVSGEDDAERAIGLGASASLSKPVDNDQLLDAIRRAAESPEVVLFEPDTTLARRISKSMREVGWKISHYDEESEALDAVISAGRAVVVIDASNANGAGTSILTGIRNNIPMRSTPIIWIGDDEDALADHMHCRVEGLDGKALAAAVTNAATSAFSQLAESGGADELSDEF